MRIAVTGSIATDHLMTFPGSFAEVLMPDKLDKVALSFLVDDLEIRRGGVAANIAFGLGCLGLRPLLVGSVGADFGDYRAWLTARGVDTSGVRQSTTRHTARFVNTTDRSGAHIGSFYAGAMAEDAVIELAPIAEQAGGIDLVLVGAGDPEAMMRFTAQCRQLGIPFATDTSWQVARLDGADVRSLLDGAHYLFANEYEAALTEQKTGWTAEEIVNRVRVRVTTLARDGVRVDQAGQPSLMIPAVAGAAEGADRRRGRVPGRIPGRDRQRARPGAGRAAGQPDRGVRAGDRRPPGVRAEAGAAERAVRGDLRRRGRR